MDIGNLIGLILTATAAGLAFWQAYRAKRYRDEILEDRKKQVYIDILAQTKRARDECRKITTPVDKPLRGVDQQKVINTIQDCYDRILEYEHRVDSQKADEILAEIKNNLAVYKSNNEPAERFKIGDLLYALINQMISEFSKKLDEYL